MSAGLVAGLQRALAAEHEAVFGYEFLGPRLAAAGAGDAARTCQAEHEAARDAVSALIAQVGATPVAMQAQYPGVTGWTASPRALAAVLEDGCAAGWRFAYAVAADPAAVAVAARPRPAGSGSSGSGSSGSAASPTASSAATSDATSDRLTPTQVRTTAQQRLTASALRATRWRLPGPGRPVVAFPGS